MTTDTNNTSPACPNLGAILYRVAWPLFLFSAVLAGLLTLSWTMLLPRFALVEVGGIARSVEELPAYKAQLIGQIEDGQSQRRTQLMAIHDPLYIELRTERQERRSLKEIEQQIREHAATLGENVVHILALDYRASEGKVTVRGDVRGSGTSSMTVLAGYMESLKAQTFVQSVTTPTFAREDDPKIGLHSPFTITLTLTDA